MNRKTIIKCPNCGAEYMPGEIYYPKHFLGQPKWVDRNTENYRIMDADGEMNLVETFQCEKCSTNFKVTADVSFSTENLDKVDLFSNNLYTTTIPQANCELPESKFN